VGEGEDRVQTYRNIPLQLDRHSVTLHFAHGVYLWVSYGSQKTKLIFPEAIEHCNGNSYFL
jgi:hypothetical protein